MLLEYCLLLCKPSTDVNYCHQALAHSPRCCLGWLQTPSETLPSAWEPVQHGATAAALHCPREASETGAQVLPAALLGGSMGFLPPISSAPGHPTHTSPCFPTITLTPHHQRASGPHRFTAASATIVHHLLYCYVPSLHIFTSSGSWPGPRRVSEAVRGRREDPGTPGLFCSAT